MNEATGPNIQLLSLKVWHWDYHLTVSNSETFGRCSKANWKWIGEQRAVEYQVCVALKASWTKWRVFLLCCFFFYKLPFWPNAKLGWHIWHNCTIFITKSKVIFTFFFPVCALPTALLQVKVSKQETMHELMERGQVLILKHILAIFTWPRYFDLSLQIHDLLEKYRTAGISGQQFLCIITDLLGIWFAKPIVCKFARS